MRGDPPPAPLTDGAFAALMDACAPFEPTPHIAVAVSGGPDSMALALLAADWAQARGGRVTGLTVDHGLRPEAAAEARRVGRWLGRAGIDHAVLPWRAPRPAGNLMAAARDARYALLTEWCRAAGVLHLLLAHHREDQAATFLLRLERGSGLAGLAGMARVLEGFPRRLRPFLDVAKDRLIATLEARGQGWIDDPTNLDRSLARNRADRFLAGGNPIGLRPDRVALAARNLARARAAVDAAVADALAMSTRLSPLGVAAIDVRPLARAAEETRLAALARAIMTVGGAPHPPRLARLQRLHDEIFDGVSGGAAAPAGGVKRTLGGCRLRLANGRLTVMREAAAVAPPGPLPPSGEVWDNRFRIDLPPGQNDDLRIGRMTTALWQQLKHRFPDAAAAPIPADVRRTLPALWQEDADAPRLVAAPHWDAAEDAMRPLRIAFTPRRALT